MNLYWHRIAIEINGDLNKGDVVMVNGVATLKKKWPSWNSAMGNGISIHEKDLLKGMSCLLYLQQPFLKENPITNNKYGVVEIDTSALTDILIQSDPNDSTTQHTHIDPLTQRGKAHCLLKLTPQHNEAANRAYRARKINIKTVSSIIAS